MGNDRLMMHTARDCKYFNPRSRVGNDFNQFGIEFFRTISIHVPAWGTTEMKQLADIAMKFQSTFPRGERLNVMDVWIKLSVFQSTFPRGERLNIRTENICAVNFNPRSRVGNDYLPQIMILMYLYFNPRSRVGNDLKLQDSLKIFLKFQSTFPRGERL